MSDTLYVGILVHEYGEETVVSGYDSEAVEVVTKNAYLNHLKVEWGISADKAESYPVKNVFDLVVATTVPPSPNPEAEKMSLADRVSELEASIENAWTVDDFAYRASALENYDYRSCEIYDPSKFEEALETMQRTVPPYFISWDTIDHWLDEMCRKDAP